MSDTEERNTSWLMWALFFLVLALGFWLWIQREQRSAEEAAEEALDAAEDTFNELESKASAATETETGGSSASAESVPVTDASTSSSDTSDDIESESEAAEEALSSASSVAEIEEVAEDAKAGDPVAEAEVAEASAAPETDTSDDSPVRHDELFREEINEIRDDKDAEADDLAEDAVTDSGEIDLTIIEGIGPKYAEILNNAGITTFAQIAEMSTDEIVDLVKANGGRKSGSMPTWAEQAKLAAAGDWDALATLQDELSGGRR